MHNSTVIDSIRCVDTFIGIQPSSVQERQQTSASSSKHKPIRGASFSSVASSVSSSELSKLCVSSCTSRMLLNITSMSCSQKQPTQSTFSCVVCSDKELCRIVRQPLIWHNLKYVTYTDQLCRLLPIQTFLSVILWQNKKYFHKL